MRRWNITDAGRHRIGYELVRRLCWRRGSAPVELADHVTSDLSSALALLAL